LLTRYKNAYKANQLKQKILLLLTNMSEPTHTYRHDSFNLDQAYYYTLLLQINAASFSYGVVYNNKLIAWDANCSLNELAEPQELDELFTANYKHVVIGLPATDFTLVPTTLYRTDKVAEYARFLDVKPDESVLAQQLDDQNFIIYKTPATLVAGVEKFNLKRSVYSSKGWIRASIQTKPLNSEVFVYTDNGIAEFLNFRDGKIRFYNKFEYKSPDDLLYYAAFVAEELSMQPRHTKLLLNGNVLPGDDYNNKLADFFQNVVFNDLEILELPDELKSQQLLTLAALSLCVSSEVL
jgi:hypothetical protein